MHWVGWGGSEGLGSETEKVLELERGVENLRGKGSRASVGERNSICLR